MHDTHHDDDDHDDDLNEHHTHDITHDVDNDDEDHNNDDHNDNDHNDDDHDEELNLTNDNVPHVGVQYGEDTPVFSNTILGEILESEVELREWRNAFTVKDAIQASQCPGSYYTVIELAVGGCCSALSSVRSGFRHLFTTETDPIKQRMATEITNAECLGDTFEYDFTELKQQYGHANYLKSGMPCRDYSSSNPNPLGSQGETGYMYLLQIQYILEYEPDIICLEQVPNALKIRGGADVRYVIESLSDKYVVHAAVLEVYKYGDVSSRNRLIIIAIHKKYSD